MRRICLPLLAGLLLVLLMAGSTPVAYAGDTWCDTDPPVVITTQDGKTMVVYVVTVGPAEHLAQLLLPSIEYRTNSIESGDVTQVHLNVTIADLDGHRHAVRSEIWTGLNRTGTLLSSTEGRSGNAMRHVFKLNIP